MRLSLRFLVPLLLVLSLIAYGVVNLVDRLTVSWFQRDLDMRSHIIGNALHDSLLPILTSKSKAKVEGLFNRVIRDERLLALGFCDHYQKLAFKTPTLATEIDCKHFIKQAGGAGSVLELSNAVFHISTVAVEEGDNVIGHLILVHDMSFVKRRSRETKLYIFYLFLILGIVISLVTVFIAHLSWRGLISGIQAMLKGEGVFRPLSRSPSPELRPIYKELRTLIRDLEADQKIPGDTHIAWTPKTLKTILHDDLMGEQILIVSNREPYIHVWKDGEIKTQFPASGLVTALEPVMRACSGTWIAHGGGSADKEVVDSHNHVHVPPDIPSYRIRRVWLSPEEEDGYYYGFANEGLWPLCHIAHARPIFRSSDWDFYCKVNEKFAKAVVEEAQTSDPVVLVQDYHFALLPQLIRAGLPKATIITFWHIPWPNPEAFAICPWRDEILAGLLGSTVMGFHTRFHCNNFLETVDSFLECRIDREVSTISHQKKVTAVRHYPISVEWPPKWFSQPPSAEDARKEVCNRHRIPDGSFIGIGVDRQDYTKGIPERLMAVERLLDLHPEWVGKFYFIQISAPTRTKIERYQNLDMEVQALVKKTNGKFKKDSYEPVILIPHHHEPHEILEYFRAVNLCFVSSLSDGMNLVAKEFVSARDDEKGVLILSMFTGAARELPEALIVNPYNIDQCAEALKVALEMPVQEQLLRMRSMRSLIREYNVYRWAGRMLIDAAKIRNRNRLFSRYVNGDHEKATSLVL